jgi:hypothetical protein
MSRLLKSLHLASLGLGLLSAVALIFNIAIFSFLYPQVTQFMEFDPSWESYGIVAAINIIILSLFQLISVITLLSYLIVEKKTYILMILAIVTGIISGIMILGDIALLSDIGKEYHQGWQTRGEWIILFISYGLHVFSLVATLISIIKNLNQEKETHEQVLKDEVLFLSLHSTGVISGWLGLIGVIAGLLSGLSLWMMERIVGILGIMILSPYLVILGIWIFRRRLGNLEPGLDEKQYQDLSSSGLWTLVITIPVMLVFFIFQLSTYSKESWEVLWLPLLIFAALTSFSSLTLRSFREYN